MGRQAGREDRNWPPLPLLHNKEVIQQQPDQAALTERYVEECVEFIREKKDGPFFLYFAHMYVHLPIYASEKFMKQSQNGRYGAGVECVDWTIAVIRDELERQGLTENTLVIFTSDNGSRARGEGGSNDPLRGYKGTTWEGGQRLPCIMCWPKTLAAGKTCKQIAASIDFLPTFAKLAGTEAPADRIIDGLDLTGLMENPEGESPRDTFFYYHRNDLEAVRKGRWKLHVAKNWQEFEYDIMLVDLENDIGEQVNVAEQNPEIVAELQALLEECRKDMGDARKGIKGENVRPRHFVDNPKPLTEYNENHPYIYAEYDLGDAG
jgi:arylsulfatase A-like enzyme